MASFIWTTIIAVLAICIAVINFDYMTSLHCKYVNHLEFNWTSSVSCHMSNGTRLCNFKNVCYLPDKNQFLFTLTEHSVLFGLTSKEDLKSIHLSSVLNHNLMSLKVVIVSNENKLLDNVVFIDEPLFLLWRFKWDNIMHVFHDDVIPLFLTYLDICGDINVCVSQFRLGFVDQGDAGPYNELYSLFSRQSPLFLHKYNNSVCIREVHTGILSTSIWFQYGFGQNQGPVNTSIPATVLYQFRDYVVGRYGISKKYMNNETVVFFNRKLNRKILNLKYFTSVLYNTVQETYPLSQPMIIELDLATHNISTILEILLTSKIVVGIHGSAMILCLFLLPGSVIVELFPFGIQPEHVSFIKAYSNIMGTGIIYRNWVNLNETLSFVHPEAPPLLGGIHHLSKLKQELIRNTKEALAEQQMFSKETLKTSYINNLFSLWYFPAPVTNISCSLQQHILTASWQPPINAVGSLEYDIVVLLDNSNSFTKRTPDCKLKIDLSHIATQSAEIWIKALSCDSESMDSYSRCIQNNT